MKKFFFCFFLFFSVPIFGQSNIEWGELSKVKGSTTSILPISGSDFYTVRWNGGIMGSLFLARHHNFQVIASGKVQSVVNKSLVSYEGMATINGKVIVFLSDKLEGKNILFMQKYGEDCKPEGDAVELSSYLMPKNWKRKGYFNVIASQNSNFVCVEYDIPGTREEKQRFGYTVLSDSLSILTKGEYESPFDQNSSEISNRYLSNTGDYFITCKVFGLNESGRVKDYSTLEKAVLVQITPEGLNEFELDLDGKRIYDMGISSDNNRIMTFTGLYGDASKGNNGVKGIFYFRLDFDKKEIIDQGFEKFDKDFITAGWTEREKQRSDRREARGKAAPQLYNYDIRETVTLQDGSIIGMLEQYYVHQITSNDPRSSINTVTYYYYYNDLIVYKIQPNGTFDWVKTIQKNQVSANDGGYYSSIAQFVTADKLVILFNDNLKNYDERGDWNKEVNAASFRKKTNTVAKVEVDLIDGATKRTTFFGPTDTEALAVPKLFETDYKNHQMLMLLIYGRKEKFGILDFNN